MARRYMSVGFISNSRRGAFPLPRHDIEVLAKSAQKVFRQPPQATFTKPFFRLHDSFALLFSRLFTETLGRVPQASRQYSARRTLASPNRRDEIIDLPAFLPPRNSSQYR